MDKKNTILLTVIAVATLLVAVVGATFAYYSVQVQNDSSQVNVNVKSSAVGVLTLSTPTTNLYMNILPEDMADYGSDKTYYATNENKTDVHVSNKNDKKNNYVVSKLVVEGGEPTTSYTCKANLKVTVNTAEGSMGKVLQAGDVKLYLNGEHVTITGLEGDSVDLHDIIGEIGEESEKTKSYSIEYKVNGDSNKEAKITADLELINKSAQGANSASADQKYLANKDLDVDIEVETGEQLDCTIDSAS